jgi:SAM-dependent methyltransferase
MKHVACPLCGADVPHAFLHLPKATINQGRTVFVRPLTVVACLACGMVYNTPRLDAEDIRDLYEPMAHLPLPVSTDESVAVVRPSLLEEDQFNAAVVAMGASGLGGASVMEVGCGQGRFLSLCDQAGAVVVGAKPSEADAQYALNVFGIEVERAYYGIETFRQESFDLITMLFVLEHFDEPLESLIAAFEQLKFGGVLMAEVPDVTRPFVGVDWFFTLEHLHNFSPSSLRAMLDKVGFVVESVEQKQAIPNTGIDSRLRVIARKPNAPFHVASQQNAMDAIADGVAYLEARSALVNRIDTQLAPRIERWKRERSKVFVFGAGSHTVELLRSTAMANAPVEGIEDSNPALQGQTFLGLPVHSPDALDTLAPNAIVISARAWESEIWDLLAPQRARGVEVVPLYSSPEMT